jgi:molybdenum cofactor cytidylyltransferase
VPAADAGCCAVSAVSAAGAPGTAALQAGAREPGFAAVVLAAGLSRRMGAPNKLLLSVDGEPLIARSVRTVLHTGFDQIVVVLGHQAELVEGALRPLGVRCVLNREFEAGQASSVRAGLAALVPPLDAVMICLGDQPLLEVSDLGALKRAFRERPQGSIVVPMWGDSRGNPVVVDWSSAEQTLQRGQHYGCRNFLDEHPERVYRWPAPNERFVRDVDLPGDYQALIGRAGA